MPSEHNPFKQPASAWDHYWTYRPRYPDTLWSSWISWHSGLLQTTHDIGTGNGAAIVKMIAAAKEQSHLVKTVHATDPGEGNLAQAKERLEVLHPDISFVFHVNKAQDSFLEPGSVDFVSSCESFHWTGFETREAVDSVWASLRPGGTFVAVFYDPYGRVSGNGRVSAAFDRVLSEFLAQAVQTKDFSEAVARQSVLNWAVGLDFIPFDAEKWTDVKRVYINTGGQPKVPKLPGVEAFGDLPASQVAAGGESIETVVDESWDTPRCTVEFMKQRLQTAIPGFGEKNWTSESWKEFAAAVEDAGGYFYCSVPVTVVLARKK